MKKYFIIFIIIGTCFSYASKQSMLEAQMLSLSCTNCHNTDGKSAGMMPSIEGKNKMSLAKTLMDFKSGKRKSTIMQKHMKGFTNQEIKKIAHYFSKKGGK